MTIPSPHRSLPIAALCMLALVLGLAPAQAAAADGDITIVPGTATSNVVFVGTQFQPMGPNATLGANDIETALGFGDVQVVATGDILVSGGATIDSGGLENELTLDAPGRIDVPELELVDSAFSVTGCTSAHFAGRYVVAFDFTIGCAAVLDVDSEFASYETNVVFASTLDGPGALAAPDANYDMEFRGVVGGSVALGGIDVPGSNSAIDVRANVTAAGDVTVDEVLATASATVRSTAGAITTQELRGDGNAALPHENLTLNAATGVTVATAPTANQHLGTLTISTPGLTTLPNMNSNDVLDALISNGGGTTRVTGDITPNASIEITDTLDVRANTMLMATDVEFGEVTAPAGAADFTVASEQITANGSIGTFEHPLGVVLLGDATWRGSEVHATGNFGVQHLELEHDLVAVTGLDGDGNDLGGTTIFIESADGAHDLELSPTLQTVLGDTVTGGTIGAVTPLSTITAYGTVNSYLSQLRTTGDQRYANEFNQRTNATISVSSTAATFEVTSEPFAMHSADVVFTGNAQLLQGLAGGATDDVTKSGTGTLTLSAVNNGVYPGTVRVTGGGLTIQGTHDIDVLLDGGKLSGDGTFDSLAAGPAGGVIWPSNGGDAATLHAESNVTLSSDVTTRFSASHDTSLAHDRLQVDGALQLANAALDVRMGATVPVGTPFPVIDVGEFGTLAGTFAGAADDTVVGRGGSFRVRYGVGEDANDATLERINTFTSSTAPAVASASFDQPLALTVDVASQVPGADAPTSGSVTLTENAVPIATAPVNGSSRATFQFAAGSLSAGQHTISVGYGGAFGFAASIGAQPVVVTITKQASATTLAQSAASSIVGSSTTFTATVGSTIAGSAGTVTFLDGGTTIGTVPVTSGTAVLSAALAEGTHSVTAVYSGDANTAGSTSIAVAHTVSKPAVVVPPFDPAKPKLSVVKGAASILVTALAKQGRVTKLTTDQPGKVTSTLTIPTATAKKLGLLAKRSASTKPVVVGTTTRSVSAAGTVQISTKLTAAAAKRFAKVASVKVTHTVKFATAKASTSAVSTFVVTRRS